MRPAPSQEGVFRRDFLLIDERERITMATQKAVLGDDGRKEVIERELVLQITQDQDGQYAVYLSLYGRKLGEHGRKQQEGKMKTINQAGAVSGKVLTMAGEALIAGAVINAITGKKS